VVAATVFPGALVAAGASTEVRPEERSVPLDVADPDPSPLQAASVIASAVIPATTPAPVALR
jgi:hypothetical protein